MNILDGKLVSEILLENLKEQLQDLQCVPKIAIIQGGDDFENVSKKCSWTNTTSSWWCWSNDYRRFND